MPETAIGFIPDVGASYFLSHMTQPEVGLFLALTGERLNGVDCYLFGLADYYIDENIESLINELYNQNHREVLTRFHRHPDESLSKIMPIIQDLKHCFDIYSDLGLMLNRLCLLNTQWSQQTYLKLSEMCPLSLKLAYESFSRGKYLNYKDCLIMEYNLVIQLSKHRSYNFREAITHKLINKAKGRPN